MFAIEILVSSGCGIYANTLQYIFHILIWASLWENQLFAYAKTKTQISFAVTSKLISAFVFATRIVQYLLLLNPKFQASRHLLWLHSLFCVGPGLNPRGPVFSQRGSYRSPFSPSRKDLYARTQMYNLKQHAALQRLVSLEILKLHQHDQYYLQHAVNAKSAY